MLKLNILLLLSDFRFWGYLRFYQLLSVDFNVVIVFQRELSQSEKELLYLHKVNFTTHTPNVILANIEIFFRGMTKKISTEVNSVQELFRKNKVSKEHRVKYLIKYRLVEALPRFLSVKLTSRLLSLLPSNFDLLIQQYHPSFIIYTTFILPFYSPICRVKRTSKSTKVVAMIYSWDNLYKDNFLLQDLDQYWVWNNVLRRDLIKYHGIEPNKINLFSAPQFDYLKLFRSAELPYEPTYEWHNSQYILYVMAFGPSYDLRIELSLIKKISEAITLISPELKLMVRTYPNLAVNFIDYFKEFNNIAIIESHEMGMQQTDSSRLQAYFMLKNAKIVINFATTMVFEAALLDKPIIQITPEFVLSEVELVYEFQNSRVAVFEHLRYMIYEKRFPNFANNQNQLIFLLQLLLKGQSIEYKHYNEYLKGLVSFSENYKDILCGTFK